MMKIIVQSDDSDDALIKRKLPDFKFWHEEPEEIDLELWCKRLWFRVRYINWPVPYRISRTWSMVRAYWGGCDFDWTDPMEVFVHQLKRLEEHMRERSMVVGGKRDAKNIRTAIHLIDRILADDYHLIAEQRYPGDSPQRIKNRVRMADTLSKQDWNMLWRHLHRHMKGWWD